MHTLIYFLSAIAVVLILIVIRGHCLLRAQRRLTAKYRQAVLAERMQSAMDHEVLAELSREPFYNIRVQHTRARIEKQNAAMSEAVKRLERVD